MRRKLSFLLLYGTLVLFGGLGALLLIWGEKEEHASLTENRMLAGFPTLSARSVRDGSFMSGIEDYLSDNVPERDSLVDRADTIMDLFSLARKTEDDLDDELAAQLAAFAQEGGGFEDLPEDDVSAPADAPEETVPAPTDAPAETPEAVAVPEPEATIEPQVTSTPEATPEVVTETPAPTAEPTAEPTAAAAKDLSAIRDCTFNLTLKNGSRQLVYTFPKENIQRAVKVLNAYRSKLPEDGHMFFAQPPFSGIGFKLGNGTAIGWDGDLEDMVNAYADDGVYMVSVQRVLEQALLNKEYLYFNTDHHWTPRAACYVANACLEQLGIDPRPYESYSFHTYKDFYGSAASTPKARAGRRPDTLDVMITATPVKGYQVFWNRTEREAPLIYENNHTYMAFLGGTKGPWRRFETGVDSGRNCLVIGDSFGLAFVPFLSPYYETIIVTDVRDAYYEHANARWTISQYMAENSVDDVYFVLSTASGVNTAGMFQSLLRYL